MREVGVSRPRKDAGEKLRGEAQFVGDMVMAGMLHGKVLRSPSRTRGSSRSTAARAEIDGVVAVLTGADLDDIEPYYGHAIKDRPIIAIDRVRFPGEPVAAVAAGRGPAEAAVRRSRSSTRSCRCSARSSRPWPRTRRAARAPPEAGLFHGLGELAERTGNVCYRYRIDAGEVEAARADAAITSSRASTRSRPSTSTRWRRTP